MPRYILEAFKNFNTRYETVSDDCFRVYGNYEGYSVVRHDRENNIIVDGRIKDKEDFENWLFNIKF